MTPDVIAELQKGGEPSPFHVALLSHVRSLVKMSRSSMSKHYTDWDLQDQVYRGLRRMDPDDLKQLSKGAPTKMVVPHTFAQVMTFSSFLFLMFNQNRTFFELSANGNKNGGTKDEDCEKILERDLRHNQWNRLLFQHLLDVGRFGPAIIECSWTRKITHAYVTPQPTVINFNGITTEVRGNSEWQEFVKYEGNQLRSISPYRFFPDTRFPLSDFQRGEFCASEEEYSKTNLRELEVAGEVAGVDHIRPMPRNMDDLRGGPTRSMSSLDINDRQSYVGPSKSEGVVIVTKVQVWLVPSKFKFGPKNKPLGPEEFPILYHVWYANDNRLLRVEPAMWWHNQFGWTVSQFTPDMQQTINLGLADLIYRLQDVMTWFVNSHISSVRRVMQNRLIINPAVIDTKSLDGESDIYIRKGAAGALMDRAVHQLQVQDVTASHMTDVDVLSHLMEVVTGVNGNAMGQYNSGRRSAQESRVVTAGAAGRMKMHGQLIWDCSFGPLGQMMLSNSRQSLPQDSFIRSVGASDIPGADDARFAAFAGTPEEVICGDSYFVYDSTLASEKGFIAQSLQGLVEVVLANPMAAQQLDIDPKAMIDEIQYLQGAGSMGRFSLSANIAAGKTPPQPPMVPPAAPTAPTL